MKLNLFPLLSLAGLSRTPGTTWCVPFRTESLVYRSFSFLPSLCRISSRSWFLLLFLWGVNLLLVSCVLEFHLGLFLHFILFFVTLMFPLDSVYLLF